MIKTLGIIPARGGSKGIIKKNIKEVSDNPLIYYTIEACKKSELLSRFLVSTDDSEIASVAEQNGTEVLARPKELATDSASSLGVVKHVYESEKSKGNHYEAMLLLQPTNPLRTAEDIDAAIKILFAEGSDSVISVCEATDYHPQYMYVFEGDLLRNYLGNVINYRRQDLEPIYYRNGAIYAFRTELLKEDKLIGIRPAPYVMPKSRSVNIDDEYDLFIAECLLNSLLRNDKV